MSKSRVQGTLNGGGQSLIIHYGGWEYPAEAELGLSGYLASWRQRNR